MPLNIANPEWFRQQANNHWLDGLKRKYNRFISLFLEVKTWKEMEAVLESLVNNDYDYKSRLKKDKRILESRLWPDKNGNLLEIFIYLLEEEVSQTAWLETDMKSPNRALKSRGEDEGDEEVTEIIGILKKIKSIAMEKRKPIKIEVDSTQSQVKKIIP